MDWAEELKMSIKKTARKGRRSKSRDILKEKTTKNSSTTSSSLNSSNVNRTKELSIDITLDLQGSSDSYPSTSSATTQKQLPTVENEPKRPPVRRISGGWADSSLNVLKSSKSKRVPFEDDRFQQAAFQSTSYSPPEDNIPIIPDLDDTKDEINSNELESPSLPTKVKTKSPRDFQAELLSQNAFKSVGIDLSILTRCLQPPENLDEADVVWDWDKVFIDVVAEINSDKPRKASSQQIKIGPDEVPPVMH